jgi:flagellar biosynthesis protein FliR
LSARVLDASVHAVALDGKLNGFAVLGPVATQAVSRAMRAGIELALPITSVLFLAEVGFGLLSRLAPQINAFLVGLPLKLLTLLLLLGSFVVVFPATADRTVADALAMIRTALRTFGG